VHNRIPSWISVVVEPFAVMINMVSCFDRVIAIWTHKVFPREESKSVLAYWYIIDYYSCSSSTKQIGAAKLSKPQPTICC